MNIVECQSVRYVIQGIIQQMRNDPNAGSALCNLLENNVNVLLGDFRSRTGCTVMEIPNIYTFKG